MATTSRIATLEEVGALVALMREFYSEAGYALDAAWAAATFTALIRDDAKGTVWIGYADDVPAGYVVLTIRFSMEFGGLDGFIDDLFVRPDFRRLGIGDLLVNTLLVECRRRGLLAVHVETSAGNAPAVALYRSHGLQDRQRLLLTRRLTDRDERPLSKPGEPA